MTAIISIGQILSGVLTMITLIILIFKPLRQKVVGALEEKSATSEALKSLLRTEILRIYYARLEYRTLRQFEYENLTDLFESYCVLKGNKFVKRICEEMSQWDILPY